MNEIEAIIQRMIDAGESEENIAAVIKYYESQEVGKQTPTAPGAVVEETLAPLNADTGLVSETVSTDLPLAEVSGFESIKNSLYNIGTDFGRIADFWTGDSAALDIASAAIANSVFGEENVKEFIKENKDNQFLTEGLGTQEILEKIPEREKEKQLRKPTLEIIESFKEGEFLKGGAAIASAFLNTVGSAAYGVATAGAGYFMDYAADNYIEYNKGLAKRKGKSLEQLIQDDEADTAKPMGIAYFQAFAENTGLGKMIAPLKKEAAKTISKTIIGKQFGAKGLAILGAARVEAGTEMFQYGAEEYNKKLGETGSQKEAAGEFVNAVFSQQGFESGLQGAFGGAGMKGARLLASSNSRPPSDVKAINKELEELTVLNKQYNLSRSSTVKEGIQNQIDEVKAKITTRVTENNDKINKLSDTQIDEINNLGDLANTQISKVQQLNEEFDEGTINRKQYNTALKGFKTAYEDSQNRINNIMLEENIEKATEAISEISDISVESFDNAAAVNEFLQQNIPGKVNQKASEQQAFIVQNRNTGKQTIVINKEIAKKDQAVTAPFHEVLHALLYKTVKDNPDAQLNLGNALSEYLNKIDVNQVKDSKYAQRLNQYRNKPAAEQAEEAITLFSDALATGDITFNENIFTKIGDVIRRTLQAAGVKVKFDTGRDVYNFVKDYNKNISEGKLSKSQIALTETKATGKLTETKAVGELTEAEVVDEIETGKGGMFDLLRAMKEAENIVKESKAEIASDKVQQLYDTQGEAAALDIINEFKPIVNKLVQKRSEAPNFDRQLLTDEIETGKRGLFDLIRAYKPESGVPLAAYINKYLPARAIEASRRILGEVFTDDVTEARGVASTDVTDDIVTQPQDKESKDARKSLRREINLNEAAVQEVRDSVKKTFGTKLPPVDSKKFKAALTKSFRNDLTKTFKNLLGTGVVYKQYLDDNFEKIFKAIPQQTLNKKFSGLFTEEVTNEKGKQLREKTQIGKKVFTKPKSEVTKQEFIDYFTGPSVYANLANSRKTSLSQLLADEIALDATMEVIQKPEVAEKREFLDKEQKTEEVSRVIDRPIDFKFSKSLSGNFEVYHGGTLKNIKRAKVPIYFSPNKQESVVYAKGRPGDNINESVDDGGSAILINAEINEKNVVDEDVIFNEIKKLKLKSKDPEYTIDELNLYELIDPNFPTSLNTKDLNKLLKSLKNKKIKAAKFIDEGIAKDRTLIENIMVFDTSVIEAPKYQMKFSKSLSEEFNKILEDKTGISADKVYDQATANAASVKKGRFKFFIPPSAEDFVGLLYATLGKGKKGDKQMDFYKETLLNPYAKAMSAIAKERIALTSAYKAIVKTLKIAPKNLRKKIEGEEFTREQAIRVYMWNKDGTEIPNLNPENAARLVKYIENDKKLKDFANQLLSLQPEGLATPSKDWTATSIDQDLLASLNTTKRKKYLEEWQENVDIIFSNENLNKLQAIYGKPYRIALENILNRMEIGRNRSYGGDALTARLTDWISNSVGAIMFFNTRSAVLQTISSINFINWSDNNLLAAAGAFANQKQYWSDFTKLMNSDFLKDRRGGLKVNVNESDIAEMAATSKNKAKGVISGLLKLGFLPTQIADSFAIASGGSTFYRNRIKSLMKEGMPKAEAEQQAMQDFSETAEESQQSSRPDRISQQQAGPLGRMILAFANTPAQYARLTKKAILDLKNRRGDAKANISKIIYYGVAQNIIFTALQQALFATLFDDEEEEKESDKYIRGANSMLDSFLRGIGFAGAAVSVGKNIALKIVEQSEKKNPKYEDAALKLLDISPPISSKVSKLRSAGRIFSWNKKDIREKGLSYDNPANEAIGKIISATTNIPVDRAIQKADNIQNALAEDTDTWQRIALLAGKIGN